MQHVTFRLVLWEKLLLEDLTLERPPTGTFGTPKVYIYLYIYLCIYLYESLVLNVGLAIATSL